MYGSRLLVGAATATLSITAAAQTFITAPIPSSLALSTLVRSTTTSTASSQEFTPSESKVHDISVGLYGHTFEPHEVNATVGDVIGFLFIRQVTLLHELNSNFHVILGSSTTKMTRRRCGSAARIMLAPTTSKKNSGLTYQMIGVINPNATHSWEVQHQFAMSAPYDLKPGETWRAEDPDHGKPSSAATPIPSTKPKEDGGKKSGLGAGAIAGIAIGAAAVVVIAAALLYLCGRRGGFDKAYRKSVIQPQTAAADTAGAPTMVEAQYNNGNTANPASPVPAPADLKSPAQASFATFSTHPHIDPNDQYRSMAASPQQPPYPYVTPPPQQNPALPGSVYGFNIYNGQPVSTPGSPHMGPNSSLMIRELNSVPHSRGAELVPVELPSGDSPSVRPPSMLPGSPPPRYESGNGGEENQFQKR